METTWRDKWQNSCVERILATKTPALILVHGFRRCGQSFLIRKLVKSVPDLVAVTSSQRAAHVLKKSVPRAAVWPDLCAYGEGSSMVVLDDFACLPTSEPGPDVPLRFRRGARWLDPDGVDNLCRRYGRVVLLGHETEMERIPTELREYLECRATFRFNVWDHLPDDAKERLCGPRPVRFNLQVAMAILYQRNGLEEEQDQ